jgi:hypothetical protein
MFVEIRACGKDCALLICLCMALLHLQIPITPIERIASYSRRASSERDVERYKFNLFVSLECCDPVCVRHSLQCCTTTTQWCA